MVSAHHIQSSASCRQHQINSSALSILREVFYCLWCAAMELLLRSLFVILNDSQSIQFFHSFTLFVINKQNRIETEFVKSLCHIFCLSCVQKKFVNQTE